MSEIITIFVMLVIKFETGVHQIYDSMKRSEVGWSFFYIWKNIRQVGVYPLGEELVFPTRFEDILTNNIKIDIFFDINKYLLI